MLVANMPCHFFLTAKLFRKAHRAVGINKPFETHCGKNHLSPMNQILLSVTQRNQVVRAPDNVFGQLSVRFVRELTECSFGSISS